MGYHAIPAMPRDKMPGEFRSGRWFAMSQWQRFRDAVPTKFQLQLWTRNFPDANVSVVLGTKVGEYRVIALDLDAEDPDQLEELQRQIPPSPMVKKGRKGETRFYLAPAEIKSRPYDDHTKPAGKGRRLVDLLTGSETRQTVVPPSVHPETGAAYRWLRGPVPAAELPVFTADHLEKLEDTLQALGWDPDHRPAHRASEPVRPAREISDDDDFWSEVKAEALNRLQDWVPQLDLYNCRPARGGFEAVAVWRPSSSGRPLQKRKRNLSIQANGIKDFGTGDTYSAIDLVMAARGVPQAEATQWLREQLGLVDAAPVFVPEARSQPTVEPEPAELSLPSHSPVTGELDDVLTRVPGLLGLITDWIADSSRRPQRGLALGAALSVIGTAAGRKYAGPTRTGTHLYVLGLARTSAGKDHALQQIARLLAAAGMTAHLGPSQFMSLSAVVKRLTRHPLTLCPMDEFGSFLARINNRRASPHEKAITGVLRTAWGSSFQTMTPPEWASSPGEPIHAPALSIYGVSTPEEFYASLEGGDVHNGFLNRFLLISTQQRPREREPKADAFNVPLEIKSGLQALYGSGSALAMASSHNGIADEPLTTADWGDGARDVYRDFGRYIEDRERDLAFLARTVEMAQRLATIRAIGIDYRSPVVTAEDMEWGRDVALWSAERMMAETSDYMADTQNQAEAQRVLRALKDQGRIKHGDLVRVMQHRVKAKDLKELISSLADAGQIRIEKVRPESGGTETTWYSAA
jgi:hypothetical protein